MLSFIITQGNSGSNSKTNKYLTHYRVCTHYDTNNSVTCRSS